MTTATQAVQAQTSKKLWTGRILSGLAIAFLLFDTIIKVLKYTFPRTTVLGAILLTGYLGGAVATHVRIGSPLFSHVLFPIYVSALIWGGIYLREWRLRALVPLRQSAP